MAARGRSSRRGSRRSTRPDPLRPARLPDPGRAGLRVLRALGRRGDRRLAGWPGPLTIPAVAWLGRRTFGPGSGFGGGRVLRDSRARTSPSPGWRLTDASFLLAWLVAMGLGMRFLERPGPAARWRWAWSVGLAQQFKYNGWLAGGIVGRRGPGRAPGRPGGREGGTVAVPNASAGALGWRPGRGWSSPALVSVRRAHGGYCRPAPPPAELPRRAPRPGGRTSGSRPTRRSPSRAGILGRIAGPRGCSLDVAADRVGDAIAGLRADRPGRSWRSGRRLGDRSSTIGSWLGLSWPPAPWLGDARRSGVVGVWWLVLA